MNVKSLVKHVLLFCPFTIALTHGNVVAAHPITPGFDLFETLPSSFVNIPEVSAFPIFLEGRPIGPANTDTIVERLQGINTFSVGAEGTIEIEMIALSLQSIDPIDIGGNLFQLFVDDVNAESHIGSMTIRHENVDGGTFDFSLPLDVLLTFEPLGLGEQFSIVDHLHDLVGTGGWSHLPGPLYPENPAFPAGGFFTVGEMNSVSQIGTHNHLASIVPEPTTLTMLALGLSVLSVNSSRRRKHSIRDNADRSLKCA